MKKNIFCFGFLLFISLLSIWEIIMFLFGSNTKVLGARHGPLTINEIVENLPADMLMFALFSIVITFMMYRLEKSKNDDKNKVSKVQHVKDPILNKIIEDALSGKTTDDILKTKNKDSETEQKENNDSK